MKGTKTKSKRSVGGRIYQQALESIFPLPPAMDEIAEALLEGKLLGLQASLDAAGFDYRPEAEE